MAPSKYVGVDGCKGGWFSIGLGDDGSLCDSRVFKAFGKLLKHYEKAELILVDIPIGLPEVPGWRNCDSKAKRKIGPRWPSVFQAPTRVMAKKSKAGSSLKKGWELAAKLMGSVVRLPKSMTLWWYVTR